MFSIDLIFIFIFALFMQVKKEILENWCASGILIYICNSIQKIKILRYYLVILCHVCPA
jgi:hypothetical protein